MLTSMLLEATCQKHQLHCDGLWTVSGKGRRGESDYGFAGKGGGATNIIAAPPIF